MGSGNGGATIRITSCCSSPAYNTCVGGEDNRRHLQFNAVDFTAQSGTPTVRRRIAANVRGEKARFRGGIGKYVAQTFVPIDTRGTASDWATP